MSAAVVPNDLMARLESIRSDLERGGCVLRRKEGSGWRLRYRAQGNGIIRHKSTRLPDEQVALAVSGLISSWREEKKRRLTAVAPLPFHQQFPLWSQQGTFNLASMRHARRMQEKGAPFPATPFSDNTAIRILRPDLFPRPCPGYAKQVGARISCVADWAAKLNRRTFRVWSNERKPKVRS